MEPVERRPFAELNPGSDQDYLREIEVELNQTRAEIGRVELMEILNAPGEEVELDMDLDELREEYEDLFNESGELIAIEEQEQEEQEEESDESSENQQRN